MSKLAATASSNGVPLMEGSARPDESNHIALNWMFTLPNPTDLDRSKLEVFASEKCQYLTYGEEVGKTGIPHLQGYLQLKKKSRGQTVKNQSKVLSMWIGIANMPSKAKKYAQKDGEFVEFGEFKDAVIAKAKGRRKASEAGGKATQGKWEEFHKELTDGKSFDDLAAKYPGMVYQRYNSVLAMQARLAPKRHFKTCVHVLFGAARCGKTLEAIRIAGPSAYVTTPLSGHWFDGYDGKSNVVIDELRKGQYSLGGLLSMMDQHPAQVQVKGGMVNWAPKTLVITSNLNPADWYNQDTFDPNTRAALWGRINTCTMYERVNGHIVKKTAYTPGDDLPLYNGGLCRCWTFESPTLEVIEDLDEAGDLSISTPEIPQDLLKGSSYVELPETSTSSLHNKKRVAASHLCSPPKKKKVVVPNRIIGGPRKLVRQNAIDLESISDSDSDSEPAQQEILPSMDLENYDLDTDEVVVGTSENTYEEDDSSLVSGSDLSESEPEDISSDSIL